MKDLSLNFADVKIVAAINLALGIRTLPFSSKGKLLSWKTKAMSSSVFYGLGFFFGVSGTSLFETYDFPWNNEIRSYVAAYC